MTSRNLQIVLRDGGARGASVNGTRRPHRFDGEVVLVPPSRRVMPSGPDRAMGAAEIAQITGLSRRSALRKMHGLGAIKPFGTTRVVVMASVFYTAWAREQAKTERRTQ